MPPLPLYKLTILVIVLCLAGGATPARAVETPPDLEFLKLVDVPHPYCEGTVDLSVAREFFVEISNDLAGRNEYNELVLLLRRQLWSLLDAKWEHFRKRFSDSPLMEPGAFLYVQSEFDRIGRDDGTAAKEPERHLRELMLLYPKSELAPVLRATVAAYFLRQGITQRALGLYETAEKEYRGHPLQCVFEMGLAESNFLVRDWKPALLGYKKVSENCANGRLKTAAMVRTSDTQWLQGLPEAPASYAHVVEEQDSMVERFFPWALYNLGEIKYRAGQYPEAHFFFDQFLRVENKEGKCVAHAAKRLADISFRTNPSWQKAAGLYLAVKEQAPHTDVGKFSYIHGLLLGLRTFAPIEYQRRLKVIDAQIDLIQDESLRSLAYLEKGLALLDAGEKSAMDYLVRLNEKSRFRLKSNQLGAFVRDRLLRILKAEVEKELAADPADRKKTDRQIFEPMEAAYKVWLKGSPAETSARAFYSQMILSRFEELMKEDDLEGAVEKLEQWTKSEIWDDKGPGWEIRKRVGEQLADFVLDYEGPAEESPSFVLLRKEKVLRPFLEPEFSLLWTQVALDTGDSNRLKKIAAKATGQRSLASVDARLSEDLQSRLWLVSAEALSKLGKYEEADRAYLKVTDDGLLEKVVNGRMALHLAHKNYAKAFVAGQALLPRLRGAQKKNHLATLEEVASSGKLWKNAGDLLGWAKEISLSGKELAPYHYLAGRASYELGKFGPAIENYENALKDDPDFSTNNEARYRLGKALVKQKRFAQAQEVFKELAKRKDSFWSPLASNEIKTKK